MPELERALREALHDPPMPGPDALARLRRCAVAAAPRPRRGTPMPGFLRRHRRIGPLAVAGAVLLAGSALAAALLVGGPSEDPRVGSFVEPAARERFEATPALADPPWLPGLGGEARIDQVPPRPSLAFPPGTTYAEAVQSFYDSVSRRGELPAGARLAAPLPPGRVMAPADGGATGVAIDLRAPFGYAVPSGVIRGPEIARAPGTAAFPPAGQAGTALPVGVRVRVPALRSCQIAGGTGRDAPCRLTALAPGAARAAPGLTAMPDVAGMSLPDALDELVRARLGLYGDAGWVPVWTAEEHRRLLSDGALLEAGDDPPTVAEFREDGLAAFLSHPRGGGARGLLLPPGDDPSPGRVVAQHPAPGTSLRRGAPVVVAAVGDDSCGGPAACAPGAEAARQAVPALAGTLDWLPEAPSGGTYAQAQPRPALHFPGGTSHVEALRQVMAFVVARGELPPGTSLGAPLPRGVVLRSTGSGTAVDLRAPFGYDADTGVIATPTLRPVRRASAARLRAGARGGRAALLPPVLGPVYLERPALPACQVMRGSDAPEPCPGSEAP